MNSVLRRSWAEVDLDVIRTNYRTYLASLREGQRIMAVVKADAYGHGDVEVASCLAAEGVRDFAVSNLLEAIRLREAGIKGQILILGYTPTECAEELCRYDITQALVSEEHAEALAKTGFRVKCQFAIDTGMNRVGLDADDVPFCERTIRKYAKAFELTGLFTHLCVADTDTPSAHEFTDGQISKFRAVEESIRDLSLPYIHYMNSAGGLWHNFSDSLSAVTLARLGIILYGLKPDYSNILPAPIKPALRWKTVVAMVKTIHAGETIGYGRTYTAVGDVVVATLPTGYADGYNRYLSNRGVVSIRGRLAPIIGRVCMDQMTVDVTDIPGVCAGDEVELIGDEYSADDMANDTGTIGYEIVCDISKRVPRVYINK